MVSTNLKSFTNEGKYFQNKQCFEIEDELSILPQEYGVPWYHQKNLYKRSFLIKNNINYPDYKRGQNSVFLANVLINLNLVYCLPIDFYAYKSGVVKTINSKDKELDYIKHFRDVLEILNTEIFKEVYLNYEEKLYDYFISTNSFSEESKVNSIKTVFGENSQVYKICRLKKSLQNKEKEIEKFNHQKHIYEERIKIKDQLIKKMISSNSWKLTIPLRRIGKLVKRNK